MDLIRLNNRGGGAGRASRRTQRASRDFYNLFRLSAFGGRAIKVTDVLSFLLNIPLSVWLAVSGALSGIAAWIVSVWKIYASIERARTKITADAAISEGAERAAFRASLLSELTDLRGMLKKCDDDKDALRIRANSAEGQIVVLRSSNEIMERWVAFFKERNAPEYNVTHQRPRSDGIP